jgi:hypothetical protein
MQLHVLDRDERLARSADALYERRDGDRWVFCARLPYDHELDDQPSTLAEAQRRYKEAVVELGLAIADVLEPVLREVQVPRR